ncbi:MAG: GntR family transcriptional regulator [Granulosicoccus sp.]|jgi:GntR family transcriptional regulator
MSALYRQVCELILEQISSGKRHVGDRLPPEAEFAIELGVSRSTLRLAFAELEACGVLRRRQRAGTQIIADKPQKKFSMATSGVHELLSLGRDTTLAISQMGRVRGQDISALRGHQSETGHWLEIVGARTMGGDSTPFSVNRVYVPDQYSDIEQLLQENETSVFQVIENTFNVTVQRVTQITRALPCPQIEAAIMGLEESTPVLQIVAALYTQENSLMEISVATFDSDRFQLQTEVAVS